MTKELIGDVWTLESSIQQEAADELNLEIERALKGSRISRNLLRHLWDNESWDSIKEKALMEGSDWYVWYMDGVNKYIREYM
jgi:hypothetical protein